MLIMAVVVFSHFDLVRNCAKKAVQGWMITDGVKGVTNHGVGGTSPAGPGPPHKIRSAAPMRGYSIIWKTNKWVMFNKADVKAV